MKTRTPVATAIAIILPTVLSAGFASAQTKGAALYALHTGPEAGCPGLDWHVTVEPNHTLVGFVAWDRMTHMARLSGSINKDGSFSMDAKEVGGAARTATVKGTAAGDYVKISIDGSGTACDDKVLNVPRAGGGLGGGGG